MDTTRLNKWADLLLDTGKRNNLINFKDTKLGAVEVLYPDFDTLFKKAEGLATFEVYDPKLNDNDDDLIDLINNSGSGAQNLYARFVSKQDYLDIYKSKLKKSSQILLYNQAFTPLRAINNLGKRAKTAVEETGVSIAYMAFGFIDWFEADAPDHVMHAPILLVPITVINQSAISPYYVKITSDDIILNPTFCFKLKNDYGIELPEYEDEGIDQYFEAISAVIARLKWSITKACKIGIFSFQKINMHKDIKDNAQTILQNQSVRTLLGQAGIETPITDTPTADTPIVDDTLNEESLYNVVDADSSQTEAIEMARSGKSFVLQGPPGTGKSQTITNIIAQCLADGKKVLFVSEKLAALNVVYDKLKKAGLEEFCLELHSHKANKKEFINQLCTTLKAPKSRVSDRAQKEIDAKENVESQLDGYTLELHKHRPVINKTLYAMYEEAAYLRNAPQIEYIISDLDKKGENHIESAQKALSQYQEYTLSVGKNYRENAWYGYKKEYSYQTAAEVKSHLILTTTLINELAEIGSTLNQRYSIKIQNLYESYVISDLFNLLYKSQFITPALINHTAVSSALNTAKALSELVKAINADKQTIDELFEQSVYKLKGQALNKKLTAEFNGFFARLFSGEYKAIIKQLRHAKKDGQKIKYAQALYYTELLSRYQQNSYKFSTLESLIAPKLGVNYKGVTTNFDYLLRELEALGEILSSNVNIEVLSTLDKEQFNNEKTNFGQIASTLNQAFKNSCEAEKHLVKSFNAAELDVRHLPLSELNKKYLSCLSTIDSLDNWCQFVKLLEELEKLELKQFVDLCIKQNVDQNSVLSAYRRTFNAQWIDFTLHQSPQLILLSRIPHDDLVLLFEQKDELLFEINKAIIKSRLTDKRPNPELIVAGSAVALLLREGEKKRKQKSIRLILEQVTELAQTLKPCFLMSPLSVSTFLPSDIVFDTVVFDEASQIFPQDAIGAIYRGKQLIVVGDSKQMPPSNFFNSTTTQDSDNDDEIEDDITDFESILDICATAFTQKQLKWHYRSRYEQLIAFSNKNYYQNQLVTFPSCKKDCEGIGVDYIFVDGIFDRNTHTNRIEAEKIVDLVFEHIDKYPHRSLGVVAFSISQQTLIDRLIQRRRKLDPTKEEFFSADCQEPFFVKNLETVQGDERDTIIFSVAYGKDEQGKLLVNFGPLNREGGERRLNVAVTRAKHNVKLVSSMHHTDIDLTRTQAVGARLLREYLDYAENGQAALKQAEVNEFEKNQSSIADEIKQFLEQNGFNVDTELGCSQLKIDLALAMADGSDYLIAIEGDGATYRAAKSTRDRDRLRKQILERMGWQYYRIWSTDWFRNKPLEQKRLLDAIHSAAKKHSEATKNQDNTKQNDALKNSTEAVEELQPTAAPCFEETLSSTTFVFPKYLMADDVSVASAAGYDKLKTMVSIINLEAPISEEWLLKRLLFMFGREKITSVVRDEFNRLAKTFTYFKIRRENGFLYLDGKEQTMLRVPMENATIIREIKYIPLEELALGMLQILKQNLSVERAGLYRMTVQMLGFTRMGDAIESRLDEALNLIADQISVDGQMICIK